MLFYSYFPRYGGRVSSVTDDDVVVRLEENY